MELWMTIFFRRGALRRIIEEMTNVFSSIIFEELHNSELRYYVNNAMRF